MKTLNRLLLTICFIMISTLSISAQVDATNTFYKNQLTVGIGLASGFEKHIFNVPEDQSVGTAMGINLSYLYFLNRNTGVGGRVYGYSKTISDLVLEDQQGRLYKPEFTLMAASLMAEGVYVFGEGKLRPYASLFLGYTMGQVESDETGSLDHSGFAVGGGAGVRYAYTKSWTISLEISGVIGKSNWSETPFLNSTGRDFDPSMISAIVGISYLWGKGK